MTILDVFTSIPLLSNVNHLALLPLLLPQLRHRNPQHPIFKMGLDLLQIRISRQPELPPELAARPLRPVPLVTLHLLLALPLSAHPQHPVLLHLDLDLTLLHAGNVQRYHVRRRGFLPVGTRQGQGFDAFWDGYWGLFEDSEGVVGGEHQVPDGLVGHERIGLCGHEECNHGKCKAEHGQPCKSHSCICASGHNVTESHVDNVRLKRNKEVIGMVRSLMDEEWATGSKLAPDGFAMTRNISTPKKES
ncbi:hypothetical protein RJ640_024895 [Escallonia rubra]|uniref:Uncharacterized protein n=1 Tax=Escallonia rubra TaxID=112253 RepID=A0AA88RI56_9ASTE|nr:hypothetical protein RJ640_024895 [Escallonia rubra]